MLESARSAVHSELSDQIGRKMMRTLVSLAFVGMLGSAAFAQGAEKWVTSWAASHHRIAAHPLAGFHGDAVLAAEAHRLVRARHHRRGAKLQPDVLPFVREPAE